MPRVTNMRNGSGLKMHSNSLNQLPKVAAAANVPPRPAQAAVFKPPIASESDPLSGALPQSLKKRRNSNTRIMINADNSVP